MKIYLASASPRRKELLEQIGLKFEVKVSHVQERVTAAEPGRVVEELSMQKAEAVLGELIEAGMWEMPELPKSVQEIELPELPKPGQEIKLPEAPESGQEIELPELSESGKETEEILIVGADTVVEMDGIILGKPSDRKQGAKMLKQLAGRTHRVYTGVTLLYRAGDGKAFRKTFHEMTKVSFYPMSGEEISRYLATGDCMDKAGAYGIQGFCARYIRGIEGDYNNVVGLPVGRLYQEAKEWLGE